MPGWTSFNAFLDEAMRTARAERQTLVDELLAERTVWPWVQGGQATFIHSSLGTHSAALNLDTIKADPPFDPMARLEGTTLWYVTRDFNDDDLLDYMLAIDDPMTPLAAEPDVVNRVARFWRPDPLNPVRMNTAQMNVSVLRMNNARPFPDWTAMHGVPRGRVDELSLDSHHLNFKGRKMWVYTPPGYEDSGMVYPLLLMQDGQWATGPLQLPQIADALIKHHRIEPVVIAMIQSAGQGDREREYVVNDKHYAFLLLEALPLVQTRYRIDSTNMGVGGVAVGALAAAHAALKNPAVFERVFMISPPLGKGPFQDQIRGLVDRFNNSRVLPERIFQSVGRYEARPRFYKPAQELRDVLESRSDIAYNYVETGSGHGLVGFRSILPEALAWAFPINVL